PSVGFVLLRAEQKETEAAWQAAVAAREEEARRRQQARQALDMLAGPVIEEWLGKQARLSADHKKFLEDALAIYTQFAAETSTDEASQAGLAKAYHRVGDIQRILGRLPEAEEAYNHGVEIYTQLLALAPGRLEYRKALVRLRNHRINLWLATGRGAQAEAALRDLVQWQKQGVTDSSDPESRSHLALSLDNLSTQCWKRGKLRDAEALVAEALVLYEKLAKESPKEFAVLYGRARARSNQGIVLALTERPAEAEQAFREALKWQKELAPGCPGRSEVRQDLGETLRNLALLLQQTERPQQAEATHREALQVRRRLIADFPAYPDLRGDLAHSYNDLGSVLASLGRPGEAVEAYQSAIALYEKLPAELRKQLKNRAGLARAHFGLAPPLIEMNRPKEAEAANRQSARLYRELAEADPAEPDHSHYLAGSLVNLAYLHTRRGELAEARRLLADAMPHHRAAIQAKPRSNEYRRGLCGNRACLAATFVTENQHAGLAEAAGQLAEAAVAGKIPFELMRAAGLLARCATLAKQDAGLPDAQCTELARSYAERAMTTLRLAVKHGYHDAARLRTERYFASVRSRPDFRELVAELEQKQKQP
ncbi:MAG: tetratricopeptide repeat protein, partial [Gemmataceae bacterium]|nr:tetratricopeptide repeat protein [Gemmataceae bacterium]